LETYAIALKYFSFSSLRKGINILTGIDVYMLLAIWPRRKTMKTRVQAMKIGVEKFLRVESL
jgi:hypothetical protein